MQRIRKGDTVVVIAGKNKGQRGKVLRLVDSKRNRDGAADRVVVERVAMVKKHIKPSQKNPQGGIVEREGSIHLSNVMLLDPGSDKPTRVKVQVDKETQKRRRVGKSGAAIEAAK